MKEAVKFLGRRYSAVNSDDVCELSKNNNCNKSSKTKNRCSILDSFFHKREAGKVARWPKCK